MFASISKQIKSLDSAQLDSLTDDLLDFQTKDY